MLLIGESSLQLLCWKIVFATHHLNFSYSLGKHLLNSYDAGWKCCWFSFLKVVYMCVYVVYLMCVYDMYGVYICVYVQVCVRVRMRVCPCHNMYVEVRGQLSRVGVLFSWIPGMWALLPALHSSCFFPLSHLTCLIFSSTGPVSHNHNR